MPTRRKSTDLDRATLAQLGVPPRVALEAMREAVNVVVIDALAAHSVTVPLAVGLIEQGRDSLLVVPLAIMVDMSTMDMLGVQMPEH